MCFFTRSLLVFNIFNCFSCSLMQNLLRCAWSPDGKHVTAGSADAMVVSCSWQSHHQFG